MLKRQRCTSKKFINILCLLSILWLVWFFLIEPLCWRQTLITDYQTLTTRKLVGDAQSKFDDVKHSDIIEHSLSVIVTERQPKLTKSELRFIDEETVIMVNTSMSAFEAEQNFHEFVSQIHVSCGEQIRVGNVSDGGWDVCTVRPYQLQKPCLVYSFGIGDNWSFDDDMATKFGCTVRSFDPSIKRQDHVRKERIHFYNIGISDKDGYNITSGWKFKTLTSLITMCGDNYKTIDYLKLDVEYDEWAALETMLADSVLSLVKQLAIEIHTKELNEEKSTVIDLHRYWDILHRLEAIGFRRWYWHFNTWGFFPNRDSSKYISCCYELVYINTNMLL